MGAADDLLLLQFHTLDDAVNSQRRRGVGLVVDELVRDVLKVNAHDLVWSGPCLAKTIDEEILVDVITKMLLHLYNMITILCISPD